MSATTAARTGMQGVFLVAAELAKRGFIVSVTSRNAFGADLLVSDQDCRKSWSVQVKTNRKRASFWLVGRHASTLISPHHIYVLVNLKDEERPEFYVAPSKKLANVVKTRQRPNSIWYWVRREHVEQFFDRWDPFGKPDSLDAERI